MTDQADTTPAPHLPPGPPPRPLSPVFWIFLAIGVLLVIAGIGVWKLGPKIWPKAPPVTASAPAQAEAAPDSVEALNARIRDLQQQLEAAKAQTTAPAKDTGNSGAVQALDTRVERLEAAQRRSGRAAAAAVAVGALSDASQTSRPFAAELSALERLLPDSSLVTGLRPLAAAGAPTRSALAAEFPDVAARASAAARAPGKGASFLSRALAFLGSIISIRRTDDVTSNKPDAVIARAEQRVADGDLEGALVQLAALPPPAQAATADWRERARRRVEIEHRIARLRALALSDLSMQSPRAEAADGSGQ